MNDTPDAGSSRKCLPIILVRGFGGLSTDDERQLTYQGFNDGTVYPHKRGENYIYEGFVLRLVKSSYQYVDATNVVGYYASENPGLVDHSSFQELASFSEYFGGHKIIADPGMARWLRQSVLQRQQTFWVFRYYDLGEREFEAYAEALVRLIRIVRALCSDDGKDPPKVNIVAHSMGGLIVREAVQTVYEDGQAPEAINKIVTLGTPHKGISFQAFRDLRWLPKLEAVEELERFSPKLQDDKTEPRSWKNFGRKFPLDRLLCVAGTNYRSYSIGISSLANRLFPVAGEYGLNYNRSDGLVKQSSAQIDGAHRTFVHKCHGGSDSLMTARESYEIATRFFFGDIRVRVFLLDAKVSRKLDLFGRSEIYFGMSVKPRRVDFELFHQSAEAENCYGPFGNRDLSDNDATFSWIGDRRLVWQGFLNSGYRTDPDLVMRLGIYVGERDLFGFGFSDNEIFNKQYFVRAVLQPELTLELHEDQDFQVDQEIHPERRMEVEGQGWTCSIGDEQQGFESVFGIELDYVPEEGQPLPLRPGSRFKMEGDKIVGLIEQVS